MTETAGVQAVMDAYSTSRCRARGVTREYLRCAANPTIDGLIDHAGLVLGAAPHTDPTGETATRNADRDPIDVLLDRINHQYA